MENATKALLIAGGVLIAIITISVLVITFQKVGSVSKTYDQTVSQEEITRFNTNFTKYLGQNLTIHEVVTICNFAYNNTTHKVLVNGKTEQPYTSQNIAANLNSKFTIIIPANAYDDSGYINNIVITEK